MRSFEHQRPRRSPPLRSAIARVDTAASRPLRLQKRPSREPVATRRGAGARTARGRPWRARPGTACRCSALAGPEHRVGRSEMSDQRTLAGRSDTRQLVKQRGGHRPVAARAVVGDRDAMGLVANPRWRSCSSGLACDEHDRLAAPRHEDLLEPLGERDDGDALRARDGERLERAGGELALAAVDHDQVRQRREAARRSRESCGEVSRLALPRRRSAARAPRPATAKSSDPLHGADPEPPVVRPLRARRPRRRPSRQRCACRPGWRCRSTRSRIGTTRQRQRGAQPVERFGSPLAAVRGLQLLLLDRERRVSLGEVENAALLTPLGRPHLDARAAASVQRRRHDPRHRLSRPATSAGTGRGVLVVLQQKLVERPSAPGALPGSQPKRNDCRTAHHRLPGRNLGVEPPALRAPPRSHRGACGRRIGRHAGARRGERHGGPPVELERRPVGDTCASATAFIRASRTRLDSHCLAPSKMDRAVDLPRRYRCSRHMARRTPPRAVDVEVQARARPGREPATGHPVHERIRRIQLSSSSVSANQLSVWSRARSRRGRADGVWRVKYTCRKSWSSGVGGRRGCASLHRAGGS